LQQAVACFQKAQETMDPVVYDHLGETLMRLKRRDEALAIWNQALQLAPNDAALQEKVKRFSK
jgi:Flp pilus assembly protein TadD